MERLPGPGDRPDVGLDSGPRDGCPCVFTAVGVLEEEWASPFGLLVASFGVIIITRGKQGEEDEFSLGHVQFTVRRDIHAEVPAGRWVSKSGACWRGLNGEASVTVHGFWMAQGTMRMPSCSWETDRLSEMGTGTTTNPCGHCWGKRREETQGEKVRKRPGIQPGRSRLS